MDEPFSALDVLTAENLRSELLELWANKTMPTKAVFLVTHNIEEAVLLADRIIVLGRNPGHIRTDFRVQLAAAPRPQVRTLYATGGLHLQSAHQARRGSRPRRPDQQIRRARSAPDALPDAAPRASRRHGRPAGTAARQGRPRRHLPPGRRPGLRDRRPAAHRGCRPTARLPHHRGRRRGHHRKRHGVCQLRDSPPEGTLPRRRGRATSCCCARFAAPWNPRATTPFPKTSSSTCSTSSSAKRSASARWKPPSPGAATPSCSTMTPDAAASCCPMRRTKKLPPARTASEDPASPGANAGHRPHLAVPHRSGRRRLRRWPSSSPSSARAPTGWASPSPWSPISNSISALPLYAFYSIVRMGIAYLLSLIFAISYGYIAAYNPRVEPWMVAVLDILQSIPVLSFLPPRGAGHGGSGSRPPDGHRDGRHPAHLHRPGVEPGLQLLLLAEDHPAGDD